jgi:hypothetical protein
MTIVPLFLVNYMWLQEVQCDHERVTTCANHKTNAQGEEVVGGGR